MHQETKNKLLTGAIIGMGAAGALLLTSMQESFEKITKCQQGAECEFSIGRTVTISPKAAPSAP